MRKELELLDEEVKCTLREARFAREELEDFCTRGKTVLDLYKWEKAKLEREVSLAVFVKLKRKNALELLEKSKQMRKELELLDEEVTCTLREARYAREELEESRGW